MMTAEHSNEFIILGASLNTGNLGVSALLASTVKCIRRACPEARIRLLDGVRNPKPQIVRLADGQAVGIERVGVRYNKTIWRENHLLRLLGSAMFARVLPAGWRKKWLWRNQYLWAILSAKVVMDITGGDSFSDIYGLRRIVLGSLRKILILLMGKDLVLLPQTYGPFKSSLARSLARWILRRASGVYSRDQEGLDQISQLIGSRTMRCKPRFCPDVAFTLDVVRPGKLDVLPEPLPAKGTRTLIGLNISGLLWNGGYSRDNMFGLSVDYRELVKQLIGRILDLPNTAIVLVPHVFPDSTLAVESDPNACREVYDRFKDHFSSRIFLLEGKYDQSEIKWIIGQCDFFLGSRMHACIAALSQGIPAVGLAYSKKFAGVFETAGVEDCVVDMREMEEGEVIKKVMEIYEKRDEIGRRLEGVMPGVKRRVYEIFETF
jgi:polysaccharide pyruvyl transferase WcaK-like protein